MMPKHHEYQITLKSDFWPALNAVVMIHDLLRADLYEYDQPVTASDEEMAYIIDRWIDNFDGWDGTVGHKSTLPRLKRLIAMMEEKDGTRCRKQ